MSVFANKKCNPALLIFCSHSIPRTFRSFLMSASETHRRNKTKRTKEKIHELEPVTAAVTMRDEGAQLCIG
jgi:hypothetical protein